MGKKKKILLKLTGTIFSAQEKKISAMSTVNALLAQLKQLQSTHSFGIVIGGGNFFRGAEQGAALGISPSIAHHVGMLATMMNGLIPYPYTISFYLFIILLIQELNILVYINVL